MRQAALQRPDETAEQYQKRLRANARCRAWAKANPEKYKAIHDRWEAKNPGRRNRNRRDRYGAMWVAAKERARERGLAFNLKPADIVTPKRCPLLGIPLLSSRGKATENSPSLDRLNPRKGYVRGNVWVISHRANRLKNNATLRELEKLVRNLRKAVRK